MQLQNELEEVQDSVVGRLRGQNRHLFDRLVNAGRDCEQIFSRLRREHKNAEKHCNKQESHAIWKFYDGLINSVCEDGGKHVTGLKNADEDTIAKSECSTAASSPRKSRPGSCNTEADHCYTDMINSLESSNRELRLELEQLQRNLSLKEQGLFNDAMARIDNSSREQVTKLQGQMVELSQELSLMNTDNKKLREKILAAENENATLVRKVSESASSEKEMVALQSNLDIQLAQNHKLEVKVKQLELVKDEHETICQQGRQELQVKTSQVLSYEKDLSELRQKVRQAKDMQLKFDYMNLHLNNQMEKLQSENTVLQDQLSTVSQEFSKRNSAVFLDEKSHQDMKATVNKLQEEQTCREKEAAELKEQLAASEMSRNNANMKAKALRERLKTMQESWQTVSKETESSFMSLKDQYQQQIKEYKSIVDSLKSQNASLNARIESMKKVADQMSNGQSSQISGLESQVGVIN